MAPDGSDVGVGRHRFEATDNVRQRRVRRGNPLWLPGACQPEGRHRTCPYVVIDHNDCVDVVGHDNVGVNRDTVVVRLQAHERLFHHPSSVVQEHLASDDFAEKGLATLRDDRDEVRAGLRVVIALEP